MPVNLIESLVAKNTRTRFAKNRGILGGYTVHIIRALTYLTFVIMLALTVIAFLPVDFMNSSVQRAFIVFFLAVYSFLALCFLRLKKFVTKHSMLLSYIFFMPLFVFSICVTLINKGRPPYSTIIGFFIIMPMIIYDERWHVNLVNIVIGLVAIALSWKFKHIDHFMIDVTNCVIFVTTGNLLGNYTLVRQLNYIDMKAGKLDRDLEILKAKNEAKTSFLANMSHEIRTPINSIIGFDEMILRECGDEKIISYAKDIQISGRSLLALINDILDFSRIEANKLDIVPVEYALDSLTSDLVNMIFPRAKEKNLELIVNVDENIPNALFGDETRIKQCVLNLLTNAVKYTRSGSVTMNVGFKRGEKDTISLDFSVIDTGIGIKAESMDKLFSAFERIDEERNRNIEGTGLGMKIVQELLDKMGSRLEVQSEYGVGSTFSFSVEQRMMSDETIGNFSERYKKLQERRENYVEMFHAPRARALVVDDVKINLTVVCNLLKSTLIQIDTAMSGPQAIDLAQQKKYDIIFLDHRMPDMDGVETLQVMRQMYGNLNKDTPVIALTANAISGAREMYLKYGFADYLTKPIDNKLLEKMLLKYLPPALVTKVAQSAAQNDDSPKDESAFIKAYRAIDGLDAGEALKNCGDEETLQSVSRDFYDAIESKAEAIERSAREGDFKNYTVFVHALKSSSRLVGEMELSRDAARLEQCGDERLADEIAEKTPALLARYKALKEKFSPLFGPQGLSAARKEKMDARKYAEALQALKECAEAFDFDSAESVINMIEACEIPQGEREKFDAIKKAVRDADTAAVVELTR